MDYTSSDGKLTLPVIELDNDKDRYKRVSGKACPLSYQQIIDLISTLDDDLDDDEFVELFDKYAAHCLSEGIKTMEASTREAISGEETSSVESVAQRSDN